MLNPKGLLYIEPSRSASNEPIIDTLTRKMTAAFRQATVTSRWRGMHRCDCGAYSSSCDYALPNGEETNSLCIHYLAFHRDEVQGFQLAKVATLDCGEAEPTEKELNNPKSRKF